jgi:hypothetical protein
MSGHGFHVHGPHDHAVEHVAQHGSDGFSNNIAVMTAVLATVGALFGYLGGATQNDAALFKNNAAIAKTTAANSWNYYQAKSNKQNLAELASNLPGMNEQAQAKYKADVARYEGEKGGIKKEAEKFEAQSDEWNHKSEAAMHTHHQWAAITLLTRRRWLLSATYIVAVVGFALGAFAWFHIDPLGALLASGAAAH